MVKDILNKNKEYILQELKMGKSYNQLAKEFGCNSGSIYLYAQQYNVFSKNKRSKFYKTINQHKTQIIDMYNAGTSAYKISKHIGCDKATVLRSLKKWGIDTTRDRKLDPNKPQLKGKYKEVIDMYNNGMSLNQIATTLGYSDSQICRLLQKYNVQTRSINVYDVDVDFFKKIDSHEKSYLLGLLFADGSIRQDRMALALQEGDINILKEAKRLMLYTGPISFRKRKNVRCKNQYSLCIARKEIVNSLESLGCMINKTWLIRFPFGLIDKEYYRSFLAGYIMGDGSITDNYCNIVSNSNFISDVCTIIPCGYTNVYLRHKDENHCTANLFLCRKKDKVMLYNWLYRGYECSFFQYDRKYKKAQELLIGV